MTETLAEKYDAGTGPEDFTVSVADEPPETVDEAAEMAEAPYGWTRDRDSGTLRPKKRPGRPGKPPGPDDIPADQPVSRAEDKAPETGKARPGRGVPARDDAPGMPRGGVVAKGVNKLYRRAGKIVRAMDPDIGQALIECATKDPSDPDELTVGEAWEELARTNPRVRRFLMRAISGNAWGDLVMAHAPIGIALLMKPAVQKLIPFGRVMESMAEPDEDTPDGEGGLPGGMTAADFGAMRDLAQQQAARMAERMGVKVSAEQMAEAAAAATARFEGGAVPPAFARSQPRTRTRAKRRG